MEFLLHHLLVKSANIFPERIAVSFKEEEISYRDLNEQTNKLATVLINKGIKRGDRVGIFIHKSIPSIISIFGILKAGAVYVPLDPKAPLSRISYIIQNCEINCLLTSSRKIDTLEKIIPETPSLKFIIVTDDKKYEINIIKVEVILWDDVLKVSEIKNENNTGIETDLAYILYTSGSTGVPKGVMISHLNALTFLKWVQTTFKISCEDTLSSHAPLHFDLSILDIFGAIQAGAKLALVPEAVSTFPIKLVDWINDNKISVWYSVPSILVMMLMHGALERYKFEKLRLLIFAGEVFPTKHLRNLVAQFSGVDFYNLYGPTETNVITYYKVKNIPSDQELPIPIGIACENMEVFALQENGNKVTRPDIEGELYARGSCVAQGYWGDPDKTAKNFILNPIQPNFKDKVYRTGDIVTISEDGNYLFKGRRDHMIKSRGYRIEIGEIEAILYNNPDIKEVAVIAIPDEFIGNRIKAFVSCNSNHKIDSNDLKLFCAKKLPHYMIPEEIEFCEYLPKTSTGKINKLALVRES